MKKIGIVGSDNSHAVAFAKIVNLPDEKTGKMFFPEYKVTHIYGMDEEVTKERAETGKIETIVSNPVEMIGEVDGVVVVFRHGGLHKKYSLPFIKAGIPVFVDKPFTKTVEDVVELVEASNKYNTPITGGSTFKYLDDIIEIKKIVEEKSLEKTGVENLFTGGFTFNIGLHNEYGGISFYGAHTVEPALTVFGYDVKSVYASRTNMNIFAIIKYDTYQVMLNMLYGAAKKPTIKIMLRDETIIKEIDASKTYLKGVENFLNVISTGKSDLEDKQFIMPVAVINMIELSLKYGREIDVAEIL